MRHPTRTIPRRTIAALGAAAALATALAAAPAAAGAETIEQFTDRLVFATALPAFVDLRRQQPRPGELDWASDGCSWSPDRPAGHDFLPGCHRHDFGYRNHKRQHRFDKNSRLRIDNQLKKDLYGICGKDVACRRVADLYYAAVRQFGGPRFAAARAALDAEIAAQSTPR
ncbi:hypothetical protein GCM10010123_36800 [Pilimelia anulata]|uniref:Phospholipase A2 n=1 Tax=Pilimelia anulata TaxID=53371 RepID=A0A8J3BHB8_9ACTN|nr:phospholipase [Pilimelia anulata]GGK03533.1 hypothetical protein GCM10010123_36800 [Pilimelia anulata]